MAEPGQTPDFAEYTLVLTGALHVTTRDGSRVVRRIVTAGQACHTAPGEWVQYATPGDGGATYISVCTPAFSPETVNRDGEG